MTLELFNYVLSGIMSLSEVDSESYEDCTYYVGGDINKSKKFLSSIYNPEEFNNSWILERIKKGVFLINPTLKKAIIPVSFSDHPHFMARRYNASRYWALTSEMKSAISRASSLASAVKWQNKGYDVSILCLDKSLGYFYDKELDDPQQAYYPFYDIDMIDYIKRYDFEYFILYSPLKHKPTPGYDEIGEYYVAPRISIMDRDYKGREDTRSFKYSSFEELS